MFTGLVTDIGKISRLSQSAENWKVEIGTSYDVADLELGESIAVDGACLTVVEIGAASFTIEASPETLRRTTLGDRRVGDAVHLERALAIGDRLGGHMVLGHVDAVGKVCSKRKEKNAWIVEIQAPPEVEEFLLEKGSITVNGVSLTVNHAIGNRFGLAIIPFTTEKTNLGELGPGDRVNLEADILGKYVKKLLSRGDMGGSISAELLAKHGFTNG